MITARQRPSTLPHLEFFSLGGVLATWWRPRNLVMPWVVSAAVLLLLSCWDVFGRAGRADFILIGLAGYELLIGLTEEGDQPDRFEV
jgi:hypothetical protein